MSNKRPIDHPEAQAFAEHIRDNPDDHTSRLVYADWLDENGFPDHASEVRGDVEKPYKKKDHVDARAKRGVRLHQAGIDPIKGWKAEDIYHSDHEDEWGPLFGHLVAEHGLSKKLIHELAKVVHKPGSHRIVKDDPASDLEDDQFFDEDTGYLVGSGNLGLFGADNYLSLSRRLA